MCHFVFKLAHCYTYRRETIIIVVFYYGVIILKSCLTIALGCFGIQTTLHTGEKPLPFMIAYTECMIEDNFFVNCSHCLHILSTFFCIFSVIYHSVQEPINQHKATCLVLLSSCQVILAELGV